MKESNDIKVFIFDNIHFHKQNLETLIKLRPKSKVKFKQNQKSYTLSFESDLNNKDIDVLSVKALNTSIVLNCFSLFEASFELALLKNLDTKNLTKLQERVMNKYIDNIIKLSSESKYENEFKFITGQSLKSFFTAETFDKYKIIKEFYVLRNLLVHGSIAKRIFIPKEYGGIFELDLEDLEYQKLVSFIKQKINIEILDKHFEINLIVSHNEIIDLLVDATLVVSDAFLENKTFGIKFPKDNPLA